MNTSKEYMPQDPRDQENQKHQHESADSQMDLQNTDRAQDVPDQEAMPNNEDMTDASRSAQDQEELIPVTREEKNQPDEEDDMEDEEEEDDVDDEEEEGGDESGDDQDQQSERGRDTTITNPGDEYPSPANNPYETNFEDPAQNRKTDPMTDHEPRVPGI